MIGGRRAKHENSYVEMLLDLAGNIQSNIPPILRQAVTSQSTLIGVHLTSIKRCFPAGIGRIHGWLTGPRFTTRMNGYLARILAILVLKPYYLVSPDPLPPKG